MQDTKRLDRAEVATAMTGRSVLNDINIALKYYIFLKAFVAEAVDEVTWQLAGSEYPAVLSPIIKDRLVTMAYLTHIDRALEDYRNLCAVQSKPYKVSDMIDALYILPESKADIPSYEDLAERFGISSRTVARDIKQAKRELGVLFFGLDSISVNG